jgi:dihydropteroate synthase
MRPVFQWNLGKRSLELGRRTLIMGVVNVTPDSFFDGGLYFEHDKATDHALNLLREGADIIDIGGESTRPGAKVSDSDAKPTTTAATSTAKSAFRVSVVSAEEELRRVIPVVTKLKTQVPAALISIDTYKSAVARAAIAAGAEIVNDVSGFRWDPGMPNALAQLNCGVVLMHMRGHPDEWRSLSPPDDVLHLVKQELQRWSENALLAGIRRDRIVLDPGLGFGKSFEENYPLLACFDQLHTLGFPLLAGVSRKSFIGRMLAENGHDAPLEARLSGTLAAEVALILKGAHIIRTHDVKAALQAARVADAILHSADE